jgi:alpha-galactosidase
MAWRPWDNDAASLMYVNASRSQAVVFNYLVNNRYNTGTKVPIKLKGLDPQKKYSVKEINLYADNKSSIDSNLILTGDFLMTVGINPDVNEWRASVVLQVDEVK